MKPAIDCRLPSAKAEGCLLRIAHWLLFLTFDVPVKLARYQSVAPFLTKIL